MGITVWKGIVEYNLPVCVVSLSYMYIYIIYILNMHTITHIQLSNKGLVLSLMSDVDYMNIKEIHQE